MLGAILHSMRPRQWVKNLFVFGGVVFSERLFTPAVWTAAAAFVIFCALSGAVYLLNDVADRDKDRQHPDKCRRPIAAGRLSVSAAVMAAMVLIVIGLGAAAWLSRPFALAALAYVTLLSAYSAWLKHMVIVDVLAVALGFVLRAAAGALVIGAAISSWLLICTILLALFLALGKRRNEALALQADADRHRPILAEYSPAFLDQMISVVTASTVTAYALYTMSPETVARFHTPLLPATLPFVLYGIFRYLYLVHQKDQGGSPSEILLADRPMLTAVVLWAAAVVAILYTASAPPTPLGH